MRISMLPLVAAALSLTLLVSCTQSPTYNRQTGSVVGSQSAYQCDNCGTVTAIDPVGGDGVSKTAGAIIGAVIGGLAGHQIGGGSGKDIATGAGAAGGAIAGSKIAEGRGVKYYAVTVDMDRGGRRVINVDLPGGLTTGTRVQVVGNDLHIVQ